MVTSKTIDTKGLPHGEREALIFPSIEKLDGGEKLRLVVEFNPLPLVYMLKARGEFDIAYEKEGPDEWILSIQRIAPEEVKKECDRIGYCCFTPQDIVKENTTVDLDLRLILPFERHEKIFQMWEALKPGETLRIINDHDPKPLHYQFEAEYKGQYE